MDRKIFWGAALTGGAVHVLDASGYGIPLVDLVKKPFYTFVSGGFSLPISIQLIAGLVIVIAAIPVYKKLFR